MTITDDMARLRSGTVTIRQEDVDDWMRVTGMDPTIPGVPLVFAFVAAQNSGCAFMGEVMAQAGASIEKGGLMAQMTFRAEEPLQVGEAYRVDVALRGIRTAQGGSGTLRLADVRYRLTGSTRGGRIDVDQVWILEIP